MKKLGLLLGFLAVFTLASCGNTSDNVNPKPLDDEPVLDGAVDITSLSASNEFTASQTTTELNSYVKQLNSSYSTSTVLNAEINSEEITQYAMIFRGEHEVDFVINVSNPKKKSVEALEITCSDTKTKVYVTDNNAEGEYLPIVTSDSPTRIMNWSGSNPYKNTYKLWVADIDNVDIQIVDMKVDGKWQNTSLSNSALRIYNLSYEDFHIDVTFDYNWTNDPDVTIKFVPNLNYTTDFLFSFRGNTEHHVFTFVRLDDNEYTTQWQKYTNAEGWITVRDYEEYTFQITYKGTTFVRTLRIYLHDTGVIKVECSNSNITINLSCINVN